MHARYVLHYRCGYVIRTCLKPVSNIIFDHVEFYKLMHRKCVKKQIFYCSRTMPIHTCTCYQSDYQLSPPDWYIQTWSSGTDPPMCMFIQISNSPSQEFLNHGEDFFLSEVQGGWGQFGCVFFVGHLVYVDRWPVLFQWSRWMVFRLCQFFPHLLSILDWYLWTNYHVHLSDSVNKPLNAEAYFGIWKLICISKVMIVMIVFDAYLEFFRRGTPKEKSLLY